jgi:hypothetical protein
MKKTMIIKQIKYDQSMGEHQRSCFLSFQIVALIRD